MACAAWHPLLYFAEISEGTHVVALYNDVQFAAFQGRITLSWDRSKTPTPVAGMI